MPLIENPCLTCGACCAHFRVSFYWAEADPQQGGSVPYELTEDLPPHRLCMRGTNQKNPRCAALEGEIGRQVRCAIHQNRPSVCAAAGLQYEDGRIWFPEGEYERVCARSRALWGLAPLEIEGSSPVRLDSGA